ncbi:hypothetical protein Lacidipiscis_01610 [Ligilactobacillus acidipiscis]|nr:hypothetical protein Lacidipiscis_01610 [Ligilactobacillus acidipiscis]GEN21061.1 hypothetical protein LAC02_43420 [Ligilactobacillus acidipiscis]
MSYFDSRVGECRVGECPVWQVVLIRVVKVCVKVDMKANTADAKMSQFSAEG